MGSAVGLMALVTTHIRNRRWLMRKRRAPRNPSQALAWDVAAAADGEDGDDDDGDDDDATSVHGPSKGLAQGGALSRPEHPQRR